MIVCVHLPRFELVTAAGGAEALAGRAVAIAPSGSGPARLGEVSGTAQAQGVRAGMALGEALARCPTLELIPGDPVQVAVIPVTPRTLRAKAREVPLSTLGIQDQVTALLHSHIRYIGMRSALPEPHACRSS